jgi:hypothetical protein
MGGPSLFACNSGIISKELGLQNGVQSSKLIQGNIHQQQLYWRMHMGLLDMHKFVR